MPAAAVEVPVFKIPDLPVALAGHQLVALAERLAQMPEVLVLQTPEAVAVVVAVVARPRQSAGTGVLAL